jgi:glycine/D-amino acid oxidase-like deaminating enzyme
VKIVIVGCGRVGASAADLYDRTGHEVIVLDSSTIAFDRLPATFGGTAIRGDGTDEDVLRRAGAEGADVFLSLTEGDNRNVMASAELGIATVCRTGLIVDAVNAYVGLPPSGLPGLLPPSGHHDTAAHHDHDPSAASAATAPAPQPTPVATREA